MAKTNHIELHERITSLEAEMRGVKEAVGGVQADVRDLLENHLPHLRQEISNQKFQIALIVAVAVWLLNRGADYLLK